MPPKRRNHFLCDSSDDSGSDSSSSSHSVSSSSVNKKKPTARKSTATPVKKRGRPSKSQPEAKRQRNLDELNSVSSTDKNTSQKSASSVRKRGRPPKPNSDQSSSHRSLILESDDDDLMPSTSGMNLKNTNNNIDNDDISDASSTDTIGFGSPNGKVVSQKTTGRKRGRPLKSQNASNVSRSPVPSTSGIQIVTSSQNGRDNLDSDASSDFTPDGSDGKRKIKKSSKKNKNVNSSVNKSLKLPQVSGDTTCDQSLVESLAQKCVYFLLVEDQTKHAIKRKAIVQHVFKDEQYSPKLYTAVICEASRILTKTFGMKLFILENQKDSYMIVNYLKKELGIEEYVELSNLKHQQNGLILYLLTVIFMNGNSIMEDELEKALKPLRIELSSRKIHPVFGDVKKYVTIELVKQMYLTYECVNKDPPQYEIKWGLRAKQEFDKRDLLNFASLILDTTPENWILQFRDAEESANPS